MLSEQAQVYRILLHHKKLWGIIVILTLINSSCVFRENRNSFQVVCDSVTEQVELAEFSSDYWSLVKLDFLDASTMNLLLQQGPKDSRFSTAFNTYQWDIKNESIENTGEKPLKFPLPCDCEAKVVDESPDGNWQIVDTKIVEENDTLRYPRWIISKNSQFEIGGNAQNWSWSTDGLYFSYMMPGHSYSGTLILLDLESLEVVWDSSEDIEDFGNIPDGFLKPIAFNYNITLSPTDKTYWYRAWFPENQNKIYVYDPISHEGRIEHIENVRSAMWSNSLNQLLFVTSDDKYITIASENGAVSAKIPYELYLEIDGEGWESELTHTNFQVSLEGHYVVFPKNTQMYALECHDE